MVRFRPLALTVMHTAPRSTLTLTLYQYSPCRFTSASTTSNMQRIPQGFNGNNAAPGQQQHPWLTTHLLQTDSMWLTTAWSASDTMPIPCQTATSHASEMFSGLMYEAG